MAGSSADAEGCQHQLVDFCRAWKTLSREEEDLLHRLVEVVKHVLKDKCLSLVKDSQHEAVLWAYSCDATPLKCTKTIVHAAQGSTVTRRGKVLAEFLLQRGFVKAKGGKDRDQLAVMFTDVLSCREGKKTQNLFSAAATFFPLLRKAGHLGICVQAHCMDRLQFASLDKLLRQRNQAFYMEGLGPNLGDQATQLELLDWVVGVGCACHDVQNSLKWGLGSTKIPQDKWSLCELHIVVESLRNSFDLLVTRLPQFLLDHLSFSDDGYDWEEVASFWRVLGVGPDMIEMLADINPWWADGKLWVSGKLTADPDCIEKVSHALLYLIRWRKFCDSRWCTVGPCCRALLCGLCVGLEAWVAMVRADATATDYHLKGIGRLSQAMKKYCIMAALVSYVPDAVLAETLVDDRLVRHATHLKELAQEEIEWVGALDAFTWERLSALLGGEFLPWELCHSALHACQVTRAFMHERVFSVLSDYPWRLAVGDIQKNLDLLAASEEPIPDSCAHKVRLLLRAGFNRTRLEEGVALLREVPWSSVPVEQAHASAAVLHRFHPGYSEDLLSTRATLHQCRHLFQNPDLAKEDKAQKRLEAMQRRNPEKTSGPHAFLGHLVRAAQDSMPSGAKLPPAVVPNLVAAHHKLFKQLPAKQAAAFDEEAKAMAAARSKANAEDLVHLQDARGLKRARDSEELLTQGVLNRVTEARFGSEDFAAVQALLKDNRFSSHAVASLRKAALAPPRPPPAEVIEALGTCPIFAAPPVEKNPPDWVATICRQRDAIDRVAFCASVEDGSRAFYFLYATQKPLEAHFLPLRLKLPIAPCLEGHSPAQLEELWCKWRQYGFEVGQGDPVPGHRLPLRGPDDILVFRDVCFEGPGQMATDADPVTLSAFLASLPQKRRDPQPSASKAAPEPKEEMSDLVEQFPWLVDYLDEGLASEEAKAASASAAVLPVVADELTADKVISDVWEALAAKRREWEAQGLLQGEEFVTFLKGGQWTARHKGKAFDTLVGQAKRGHVTRWCNMHQLKKVVSFSLALYGEGPATAMALEWCRRMQHFYDLWVNSPGSAYSFSPSDMDAYQPGEAFTNMKAELPPSHPAWVRVQAIESMFPTTS